MRASPPIALPAIRDTQMELCDLSRLRLHTLAAALLTGCMVVLVVVAGFIELEALHWYLG